jgi:4-hydroxythreonine-4-phosphate dehydrogenase
MGDPAGCGPEITVKALHDSAFYDRCNPMIVGDAEVFEDAVRILEKTGYLSPGEIKINRISNAKDGIYKFGTIDIYHLALVDMKLFEYGKVSKMCGNAAFQCVAKVIELAMEDEVDATVTNALNKEAINLAGHHYSGHTEIYADYTKTKDYAMMLAHEDLRVIHVSTHVSLREACDRVKKDRVLKCIHLANHTCKHIGIAEPRIAVAGLNPHAGENGLFGREEIDEITPAIEDAKKDGILVSGPHPADTIFSKARGGLFDIVVVMYHDQGHIPLKVIGFVYDKDQKKWNAVEGVNITLGLPIVRVSVDHGTAFGHAGQGIQNESSLVNAINYAIHLSNGHLAGKSG